MVTREEIKTNLECSDMYAQKLIEYAQGDEEKLEDIYYLKLDERRLRPSVIHFGGDK